MSAFSTEFGKHDIAALTDELVATTRTVVDGDRRRLESMLFAQVTALQAIFVKLSGRAAGAQYIPQLATYLRLALKAQSQSRTTLESLAAIKNLPIVYARRANIARRPERGSRTWSSHCDLGNNRRHNAPMRQGRVFHVTATRAAYGVRYAT